MLPDVQLDILPYQVFISYAKEDVINARSIYDLLGSHGIRAWIDVHDLNPGDEWQRTVRNAIRTCRYVLVLVSARSVAKDGFVQKEIRAALDIAECKPDGQQFIIPARLEECTVPERLVKWQWCDVFRDNGRVSLVHTLQRGLGIPSFPLLKEHERELRASMSSDLIADTLLFQKFSRATSTSRTRDPGTVLYISNGHCLDVRRRTNRFIQLFDQTFPNAQRLPSAAVAQVLNDATSVCGDQHAVQGADLPDRKDSRLRALVLRTTSGARVGIDEDYFVYARLKYPRATIYAATPDRPVVVAEGNDVRFLAMPVRIDSSLIQKAGGAEPTSPRASKS
jgi:hypothetical protein